MLNMNRATLLGRAGRDPDIRDLKNGGRAAVFTLATTEKWKDAEGRPGEATEWHRVVVYGAAVKAVETMLRKGDAVLVEGRIATRGFRDREGTDRTVTEIVVAGAQGMVNMLGGRRPGPAPGSREPVPASEPGGQAPEPGGREQGEAAAEAGAVQDEAPVETRG